MPENRVIELAIDNQTVRISYDEICKARQNLIEALNRLNTLVIGRDNIHRVLMVTLVAHENAVLIGPKGCAKTFTIECLSKLINAKFYKYLLTRFTTDTEVLGVYNVKKIIEEGRLERSWTELVNCDIAFFDEIFKANSAILNALLSLLNERVLYDPYSGQKVKTNIISVFGASNEVPQEEELQALYDRFVVRIFLDYLSDDDAILRALISRWIMEREVLSPVASASDVRKLHYYARYILGGELEGSSVKFVELFHESAVPIIKDLRARGIVVSDRTLIEKLPKLVAAYCALYGVSLSVIYNAVLDLVPHLAEDASQYRDLVKYVEDSFGEVWYLHKLLVRAREAYWHGKLDHAAEICQQILMEDFSKIARDKPAASFRLKLIYDDARALLSKIRAPKKAA